MTLTRNTRCSVDLDSKWMELSAICMGLSFFLRTVYYFAFTDISIFPTAPLVLRVILPLACCVVYLLLVKGKFLNSPLILGCVIAGYSLLCVIETGFEGAGCIWAVLLLVTAAAYLATALGLLPSRLIPSALGITMALWRLIFVDVSQYILPLNELDLIAYLPAASILFGSVAVGFACPALKLSQQRSASEA